MKKKKLVDRYKRQSGMADDLNAHGWHSRAYHRHFEGYTEIERIDERGHARIERVYAGVRYTPDIPPRRLTGLKLLYVLLWLSACAAAILAGTREIAANHRWFVALVQFLLFGGLLWEAVGLFNFLTAPRSRTVGDYKSSHDTLIRGTLAAGGAFILCFLLNVLCLFLDASQLGTQLLALGLYLLGAVLTAILNRLESNLPYTETALKA